MLRYVVVSLVGGILFGVMDAAINANALAQRLFAVYRPIARTSIDAPVGIVIDLVYGFALAGIYLLLFPSLPGSAGLVKGLAFGVLIWFLRVAMKAASDWVMFQIPGTTLVYALGAGLLEMIVLGMLFGLTLHPAR